MGQCCCLFMAIWKEFYNEKETKIRRVYIIRNVDCLIDHFVLILLFVPNLAKHKETVDKKGNEAIVKIVESQIELYTLEKNRTPSLNELVKEGYITKEQLDKYTAEKQ